MSKAVKEFERQWNKMSEEDKKRLLSKLGIDITTPDITDDKIFLLSVEEYEKYKKTIPVIGVEWWLRSPGPNSRSVITVKNNEQSFWSDGYLIKFHSAVRPVLRLSDSESSDIKIGETFIKYKFPWVKIDDNLAIAEVPIAFKPFDKESNEYEESDIRNYLLSWFEERSKKEE